MVSLPHRRSSNLPQSHSHDTASSSSTTTSVALLESPELSRAKLYQHIRRSSYGTHGCFLPAPLSLTWVSSRTADDLIATTHSIQYNLGLSLADTRISDLRPAVQAVATECSKFVDSITRSYNWQGHSFLDHVELRKIRARDTRAEKEYSAHFDQSLPLGIRASLFSFQASLNFLDEMLSTDLESASRGTITKLKYITVRHTYNSLRRIQQDFGAALAHRSSALLGAALTPPTDAHALTAADNRLRNVLVHYGLGKIHTDSLSLTDPLFGLVEALAPGHTFDSFAHTVSREVQRLSTILDTWSGP